MSALDKNTKAILAALVQLERSVLNVRAVLEGEPDCACGVGLHGLIEDSDKLVALAVVRDHVWHAAPSRKSKARKPVAVSGKWLSCGTCGNVIDSGVGVNAGERCPFDGCAGHLERRVR